MDAAFETAGDPRPLADCIAAATQGGAVVLVGVNGRAARFEIELHDFHFRDLRLIGSYGGAGRGGFRAAAGWLGQIALQPLISHRFGLAELEQAFATARGGAGGKVLVSPGATSAPSSAGCSRTAREPRAAGAYRDRARSESVMWPSRTSIFGSTMSA